MRQVRKDARRALDAVFALDVRALFGGASEYGRMPSVP